MSNTVCCPECGSESITANKKGFSGKKAVAGAVLTGGIGLLAGTIGSSRIIITCLNCGHKWKPGAAASAKKKFTPTPASRRANKIILLVFLILMTIIILICRP